MFKNKFIATIAIVLAISTTSLAYFQPWKQGNPTNQSSSLNINPFKQKIKTIKEHSEIEIYDNPPFYVDGKLVFVAKEYKKGAGNDRNEFVVIGDKEGKRYDGIQKVMQFGNKVVYAADNFVVIDEVEYPVEGTVKYLSNLDGKLVYATTRKIFIDHVLTYTTKQDITYLNSQNDKLVYFTDKAVFYDNKEISKYDEIVSGTYSHAGIPLLVNNKLAYVARNKNKVFTVFGEQEGEKYDCTEYTDGCFGIIQNLTSVDNKLAYVVYKENGKKATIVFDGKEGKQYDSGAIAGKKFDELAMADNPILELNKEPLYFASEGKNLVLVNGQKEIEKYELVEGENLITGVDSKKLDILFPNKDTGQIEKHQCVGNLKTLFDCLDLVGVINNKPVYTLYSANNNAKYLINEGKKSKGYRLIPFVQEFQGKMIFVGQMPDSAVLVVDGQEIPETKTKFISYLSVSNNKIIYISSSDLDGREFDEKTREALIEYSI